MTVLIALGYALPVGAQDVSYSGAWRSSPLSVSYSMQSWGPECGPRPGTSSGPGGYVTISSEGSHLRFAGAFSGSTNACWSDNAEVRRVSASARADSWSASCATAAGNARGESGRYSFTARDVNTIAYQERTTYSWQVSGSTCTATRNGSRTLTRAAPLPLAGEAAAAPSAATLEPTSPSATPAATPSASTAEVASACVAGEPNALRLRGPDAPIEPGERACLSVRVIDAAGCALVNPRVEWRVAGPTGATGRMDGRCFVTNANAAEAEGLYRVDATLGRLEASAEITVRAPDLSGLIAVRERRAEGPAFGIERAESEHAAGVAAVAARPSSGRLWLLLGVALVLVGFGSMAALLIARSRRNARTSTGERPSRKRTYTDEERKSDPLKNSGTALIPRKAPLPRQALDPTADPRPSALSPAPPEAPAPPAVLSAAVVPAQPGIVAPAQPPTAIAAREPLECPVCGVPGGGEERFCAKHGERLVPRAQNPLRAAGMICPSCRRGYPANAEVCTSHEVALVPYTLFRNAEAAGDARPRICPTCGERYAQHVTFCGKDGASLTSVN